MWRILIGFLLISGVHAAEPAQWAQELNTAYLNNGGYVAVYASENSKGTLEITLGLHPISEVSAAFMNMNANEKQKVWFWTRGDDSVFMRKDNGEVAATMVMRGLKSAIQTMARIDAASRTDPQDRKPVSSVITMSGCLETDRFSVGPLANSHSKSPWMDDISNGVITASDADTLTLRNTERGELTLSRKHGLLLSQSCPNSKGDVRIFKLRDLQLNPSRESVEKIFEGLDDKAQADMSIGSMVAGPSYDFLKNIVWNADRGFADPDLLETACEEEAGALRALAGQCVGKSGGTLLTAAKWKEVLTIARDEFHQKWIKDLPAGMKPDEKDFEIFLARADIREGFRRGFAKGLASEQHAMNVAMNDLFQKQLVADTEPGKAAKRILEFAFTKAYVEAITDAKMKEEWDQPKSFD